VPASIELHEAIARYSIRFLILDKEGFTQ